MRTFFVRTIPEAGKNVELPKDEKHHLFRVLRAENGENIRLLNGKGKVAYASIVEKDIIISKVFQVVSPSFKIHVFFALPKRHKIDILLSQATELGAHYLHPLKCQHSVVIPQQKHYIRWKKILIESIKQSGNPFLPELCSVKTFYDAVQYVSGHKMNAFFGSITGRNVISVLQSKIPFVSQNSNEIAWFVGPEGGFSSSEEQQMLNSGFFPLKLSDYVLRIETAVAAGITILSQFSQLKYSVPPEKITK